MQSTRQNCIISKLDKYSTSLANWLGEIIQYSQRAHAHVSEETVDEDENHSFEVIGSRDFV